MDDKNPQQLPPANVPNQQPSAPDVSTIPAESEPPTAPIMPSAFDTGMPPPPVVGSGKKSKKKLVIILAIIFAVLIGGGASAYFLWYQNPQKVVSDAIVSALQAKTTTYTGEIMVESTGANVKLTIDGGYDAGAQNLNADAVISVGNIDYKLKAGALIDANRDVYIRIANLDTVTSPLESTIPMQAQQDFRDFIAKLNNKWVKIDAAELTTFNADLAKSQSCIGNAVQQTENNASLLKEIEDNYKKNSFVIVGERLADKDGNMGYVLTTDRDKAKAFATSLKETKAYKTLHDCDNSFDLNVNEFLAPPKDGSTIRTELWVTTFTHRIASAKVLSSSKDGKSKANVTLNPKFNTPVELKAPSEFVTLKQLQADFETLQQKINEQTADPMRAGL